jgi:hypothetical protein
MYEFDRAGLFFLMIIWPEILQGIAADQPGDGCAKNSKYHFEKCYHTRLLLAAKRQLVGGSMQGAMFNT